MRLLTPPPRDELLRSLAPRLGDAAPGWQPLASGILGADARIDFVGIQPGGRLTAVLVGQADEDLALVARGLAQAAWLDARIPDWLQLSRELAIRPDLQAQVILLCPGFRPESLAAARAVGDRLRTATYRWVLSASGVGEPLIEILLDAAPDDDDDDDEIVFEPVEVPGGPNPRTARSAPAPATPSEEGFRTGLGDEDLGLTQEESAEFE